MESVFSGPSNPQNRTLKLRQTLSLNDFAAAQAGRANANALAYTLYLGVHRAQIDVPAPLGDVVGVADVISKLRPLAADFAYLCHDYSREDKDFATETLILLDF